jgi:small subunit ribosomal protein S14
MAKWPEIIIVFFTNDSFFNTFAEIIWGAFFKVIGASEWWNSSDFVTFSGKNREKATLGLQPRAHPVTPAPRIMAKKSWIARNARKKETVEKYAALRLKLKAEKDYVGLSMLPRDASPTRLVNRCEITGRRRAFLRRFRLSRITFRELASAGMLPGVTKSSW